MTVQHDDASMEELFAAFDDVHASDELKARTLDAIPSEPKKTGARARVLSKSRIRVVRFMAAAACFAALAVGGVAYAMPASSVTLSAGDATVDLGVNCFGITVSADSEDAEVQRAIDGAQLRNIPYDESIGRLVDSLGLTGEEPVQVSVESGDEQTREDMEKRATEIVAEKAPMSSSLPDAINAPEASGAAEPSSPGNGAAEQGASAPSEKGIVLDGESEVAGKSSSAQSADASAQSKESESKEAPKAESAGETGQADGGNSAASQGSFLDPQSSDSFDAGNPPQGEPPADCGPKGANGKGALPDRN